MLFILNLKYFVFYFKYKIFKLFIIMYILYIKCLCNTINFNPFCDT